MILMGYDWLVNPYAVFFSSGCMVQISFHYTRAFVSFHEEITRDSLFFSR